MYVKASKKLMMAAAVVIMLNFSSCGKYEDGPSLSLKTKTARLTGSWEVVEIDGDKVGADIELEFDKDGGLQLDYDYSYTYYGYTYEYSMKFKGEWEWGSNKESIELDWDDMEAMEWDILRLSSDELWVEDDDNMEWELEKLD